ncbi:MAG TPA: C40 family peptidase [Flavobacteriaceae bacterium]|nr:C40 family peptidase [Flavobacteriaceae bacterium]
MRLDFRYTILSMLLASMSLISCSTSKSTTERELGLEIVKRTEYPGDGDYFASSESDLEPIMDLPEWDIPELMPIEEYDAYAERSTTDRIIKQAKSFNGTPYKFGGTTKKGMDCSGLIYTAFKSEDIYLPRISSDMARRGKQIKLNNVQPGDLLFFKTNSRRNRINHVGLVVEVNGSEILFIHSSTSRGVITSSINEAYWQRAFTEARRVL